MPALRKVLWHLMIAGLDSSVPLQQACPSTGDCHALAGGEKTTRLRRGARSSASRLAQAKGLPAGRCGKLPQPAHGARTAHHTPGYASAGPCSRPTPPASAVAAQGTECLQATVLDQLQSTDKSAVGQGETQAHNPTGMTVTFRRGASASRALSRESTSKPRPTDQVTSLLEQQ